MDELRTGYADTTFSNGYEFTQGRGYQLPEYPFTAPAELLEGRTGEHPIVIVGAGLAGLTAACALATYGVPAVVLDEDNTVGVKGASSRGICYTQKSLEIFHRLGVYERIARKGIQWSVGRTFAGKDEVYSFDLRQQSAYNLSTQPPFINIQQFYIEGYLVERIQELGGVELRWMNRVTGFEQDANGATLSVTTPAGDYRMRAAHVIDASGSRSPFRQWAGAAVTARKGDDRWCIADVRFSKHPPVERHTWIEAPFNENRAVWQHLMGDDVWRIDYQMAPNCDPQEVSREEVVRERLRRQFGPDCEVEIVWVGPYAYRSECVDAMRHGRLYFVGDAAKVVSPFGARGGNTGVAGADNLAWELAAVLKGRRPRRCWTATTRSATRRPSRTCWSPTARPASCGPPTASRRCSAPRPWAWPGSSRSRASWSTPAAWPSPTRTRARACARRRAASRCRTWPSSGPTGPAAWSTSCCSGPTAGCCCSCSATPAGPASRGCASWSRPRRCAACRCWARTTGPARWSTCATPKGTCRAPATCSAMPGRWCGPTATWPPPARAWTRP